jgi:hypothetical protein
MFLGLFERKNAVHKLTDLESRYHSYRLSIPKQTSTGIYQLNQACKEPIILSYILLALAKCKREMGTTVTFAELFCLTATTRWRHGI